MSRVNFDKTTRLSTGRYAIGFVEYPRLEVLALDLVRSATKNDISSRNRDVLESHRSVIWSNLPRRRRGNSSNEEDETAVTS